MKKEMRCSRAECNDVGLGFPHNKWDDEKGDYSGPPCPGPGVEVEIPYRDYTYPELANKIDSEGFDYFFNSYASLEEFHDEALRGLVEEYQTATQNLTTFLAKRDGLF